MGETYYNFNPTIIGNKTIRWLGDEALSRYLKLKPPSYVPNKEEVINDIRKTVGGAILDPEDLIKDVLDDNDFISIGNIIVYGIWNRFEGIIWLDYLIIKISYLTLLMFLVLESDRPDPKLNKAEIKYVPEQM